MGYRTRKGGRLVFYVSPSMMVWLLLPGLDPRRSAKDPGRVVVFFRPRPSGAQPACGMDLVRDDLVPRHVRRSLAGPVEVARQG